MTTTRSGRQYRWLTYPLHVQRPLQRLIGWGIRQTITSPGCDPVLQYPPHAPRRPREASDFDWIWRLSYRPQGKDPAVRIENCHYSPGVSSGSSWARVAGVNGQLDQKPRFTGQAQMGDSELGNNSLALITAHWAYHVFRFLCRGQRSIGGYHPPTITAGHGPSTSNPLQAPFHSNPTWEFLVHTAK
jgi:hypothetical protein